MGTMTLKDQLHVGESVYRNGLTFEAEKFLRPHNQKEKGQTDTPCIHSTPGEDATQRPLLFHLGGKASGPHEAYTPLQRLVLISLNGLFLGALVSAIIAGLVARTPVRPPAQEAILAPSASKACFTISNGQQRCV